HERGAGADLVLRVPGRGNAADADDGDPAAEFRGEGAHDLGAAGGERPAGKPAGLARAGVTADGGAVERRVRGDEAVQTSVQEHPGERLDMGRIEVGRDLEEQRNVAAVLAGEFLLLPFQGSEEPGGGLLALEVAQPGGV